MSNQIENLIPRIVAKGMLGLREQAVLPRLINGDFSPDSGRKGDVVDVPLAQPIAVGDVVPGVVSSAPKDSTIQTVPVRLKHWKKAGFYLTDREMAQIELQDSFMPLQMHEAIRALANAVHESILDVCAGSKHLIGDPDNICFQPFVSGTRKVYHDVGVAVEARRLLNAAHAPKSGRSGLLSLDTEAQALSLPHFYNAERSGSDLVPLEGEIGRKFGIDWYSSELTLRAGKGAAGGTLHKNALVGAKTIDVVPSGAAIVAGQILKFNGDNTLYTVTKIEEIKPATKGEKRLSIYPALVSGVTTASVMTWPSEKQMNLVFHRDAIALAMRPLTQGGMEQTTGSQMMSVTDPQTGLSLRLEVTRQYKQTVWEFDMLWGVSLIRPEFLVRFFG